MILLSSDKQRGIIVEFIGEKMEEAWHRDCPDLERAFEVIRMELTQRPDNVLTFPPTGEPER